ncbi:hypothetical protein LZ906_006515 [Paraclostridium ghonii]|uniref:YncE family protein n=1 Tax=Paraclostridium ghonii TaxID=29358 RepID=UPI003524E122
MLKNIKQDIKNITLLLFIVGILSLIVYISVYENKEFSKNVKLDEKTYDYNESNYKNKNESIKLDSVISINDYILDLEFYEDRLLAIGNYADGNKTGINIYQLNTDDESISNVKTLNDEDLTFYKMESMSPSKEILIYSTTQKEKKENYKSIKSVVYNLKDDSYITLPYYFDLLGWVPDSSGFYGYKKGELFSYDIKSQKIVKTDKLKKNEYINKILFSQDATKLYMLNMNKNEIDVYDLKNNSMFKINSIKYISDFDVIDDTHLLINGDKKNLYVYDTKNKSKKVVNGIHLDEMYLSKDKSKLVTVNYTGNNESTIDVYELGKYNNNVDLYKLGSIPMIKGMPYIDISDDNKLAYSIEGTKFGQSEIYTYSISNKK